MKRLYFLLVLIIPLLVSCPVDDPFGDIEGIDLLSDSEKAFTDWSIDYGATVAYEYMTFTDSVESGPSADDTVKRIEIVNLVPNGDFRAAPSAAWTTVDAPPTFDATGEQLNYALTNDLDRIEYDLSDASDGLEDGIVNDAVYIIHFDINSNDTGTSYFEYRAPTNQWSLDIKSSSATYDFPLDFTDTADGTFTPDATTNIFTIGTTGTGGAMAGYIDNLRVARTDISSCITINIPVVSEGREDLLSGTYRFTVWVKNDPDVTPVTDNRMPASDLNLSISTPDDIFPASSSSISHEASSDWDDWTACSVTGFIQVDVTEEDAINLQICPTNKISGSYKRDVGSLLIASPTLEYSSDGTFE